LTDAAGSTSVEATTYFPENPRLAEALVARCSSMVAVDPSPNVEKNRFATERVQRLIEDYRTDRRFDLITLRMVVEHVDQPRAVADAVAGLLSPGGCTVVFTVNRLSPLTVLSRVCRSTCTTPSRPGSGERKKKIPSRSVTR
jgi:hypothetical protein